MSDNTKLHDSETTTEELENPQEDATGSAVAEQAVLTHGVSASASERGEDGDALPSPPEEINRGHSP